MINYKVKNIKMMINLFFLLSFVSLFFSIYKINESKIANYQEIIKEYNNSFIELSIISKYEETYKDINILNKFISFKLKTEIDESSFKNSYSNPDLNKEIFDIIFEQVKDLVPINLDLIIGNKTEIIYNESLDKFNVKEWEVIFSKKDIEKMLIGNNTPIFIKYENNMFIKSNMNEVIEVVKSKNVEEIKKIYMITSSTITEDGDITGNSDINYKGNNISDYKLLMIFKEPIINIYNNDLLTKTQNSIINNKNYNGEVNLFTLLSMFLVWFFYILYTDKINVIINSKKR